MFCDRCGTNLQGAASFCPTCGKPVGAPMAPPVPPPRMPGPSRIAVHLRTLGFLWIGFSILRLVPRLLFYSFWRNGDWFFFRDFPFGHWLGGVAGTVIGLSVLTSVLGIITGWGLLERQPWARILAIVLGFLSLLQIPFGTALGIFTLWVLLPAQSEQEYRQISG